MGVLAECWQTAHTTPPRSCNRPTTGIRVGTPPARPIKPRNEAYHPIHPRDKERWGREGPKDDSSPGARPPKEETLESSQVGDRTSVTGANRRITAPVVDFLFHPVFKVQSEGMSTPTDLFAFAEREKSVPARYARNQDLGLEP